MYMRMHITKCCTLEVTSKQASINLVPLNNTLIFLKCLIHYKTAGALTFLFTPCMECCDHTNCLHIPMDKEESNLRKDKRITTAQ